MNAYLIIRIVVISIITFDTTVVVITHKTALLTWLTISIYVFIEARLTSWNTLIG